MICAVAQVRERLPHLLFDSVYAIKKQSHIGGGCHVYCYVLRNESRRSG